MAKVVLTVPKQRGGRLKQVTATLADWTVTCDDPQVAARLEQLKPEPLGYLPGQEYEWAKAAERFLKARITSVEWDKEANETTPPGVCFSSGPLAK